MGETFYDIRACMQRCNALIYPSIYLYPAGSRKDWKCLPERHLHQSILRCRNRSEGEVSMRKHVRSASRYLLEVEDLEPRRKRG